ncbi:unnamed protein product, partial [Prorocentrum cordatum]
PLRPERCARLPRARSRAPGPRAGPRMAGPRRASFSTTVELICFDAESGTRSPTSFQHVETAGLGRACLPGARGAARRPSSPPPGARGRGRGGVSAAPWARPSGAAAPPDLEGQLGLEGLLELEAECMPGSLSTEPGGSDADSFADENRFAKVAQQRRIRRSVTANQGPGLPQHALLEMAMSRILSRRRRACLDGSEDSSSGNGTGSINSLGE